MIDFQAETREALADARRRVEDVVPGFWKAGIVGRNFVPTREVFGDVLTALWALDARVRQLEDERQGNAS